MDANSDEDQVILITTSDSESEMCDDLEHNCSFIVDLHFFES